MKKINNFDLVCKNLGIPIVFIRKIEKSLKKFNGKIYIVGGNVRDLILNKSIINHPDLVVNLDLEKLQQKCLKVIKITLLWYTSNNRRRMHFNGIRLSGSN